MLKPVMQLAAVGLVGVVLWKLAGPFLLPLFFFVFKIGLIVALIMLAVLSMGGWGYGTYVARPAAAPGTVVEGPATWVNPLGVIGMLGESLSIDLGPVGNACGNLAHRLEALRKP